MLKLLRHHKPQQDQETGVSSQKAKTGDSSHDQPVSPAVGWGTYSDKLLKQLTSANHIQVPQMPGAGVMPDLRNKR